MTGVPSITFTAHLAGDLGHIPLPFDPRAIFGRARPPVTVAIGGHVYRSTIAIMAGETFVPLRRSNREAAGVVGAGAYAVTLTLDTAPRDVALPDDLATALDAAGARDGWDALSFTRRRELAEAIEDAKRVETRERRLGLALAAARNASRRQ
ncbi:YdeI/OmpD-associated family protein [Sphingomonas sp. MMS24-JH45]